MKVTQLASLEEIEVLRVQEGKEKAHATTFIFPEAKLCSSALRKSTTLLDGNRFSRELLDW